MKFTIRNQPDFFAGLLFVGLGVAFGAMATRYTLGTPAEMGPGFFPLMLGGLLTLLGSIIAFRSITRLDEIEGIEPVGWRPFFSILGSLALFGLLLRPLGFVIASFVLVMISASASHEFGWRYALLTGAALVAACYGIFFYGLGLPMPVWPEGF